MSRVDWVMFQDTARLFLESRIHEIYPGVTEGFPFFYPPYFVSLIAPLGVLSRPLGYLTIVALMVAAMGASLVMLRRLLPGEGPGHATVVLAVLASASWNQMIVLGQLSTLYVLILVSAICLWARGRRFLAGAALSLLMIKPNLGLMFPALLLLRRQWLLLAGWVVGMASLIVSTVPMGMGVWLDYVDSGRAVAVAVGSRIPMWKQQTLYAFWRTSLGMPQSREILSLWLVTSLPLLVLTARAWLRTRLDAEHLPRLFGLAVLATLSCNLYMFAYDTLLLVIPALAWCTGRRDDGSRPPRGSICLALLFVNVWQYVSLWVFHGGWALVGPAMAAWLIADARDLLRRR